MHMPKTSAIRPQHGSRPLGKIEVLPNAIHSIAVQAISECYGVVGKFSIEKMLGVPVTQVNVNVQGLSNSANNK